MKTSNPLLLAEIDTLESVLRVEANELSVVKEMDTLTKQNKQLVEDKQELVNRFQILIHEMKKELTYDSSCIKTDDGDGMFVSMGSVNSEISKIKRALFDGEYMNELITKYKELNDD